MIALAKANNIACREKHVMPDELRAADEVFVTGSAAEIQPVGKIDSKEFALGLVTQKIAALYKERVRQVRHG